MNKKGISAIVATVLVILISVVGVRIVWFGIAPLIEDNLNGFNDNVLLDIVTSEGYTIWDSEAKLVAVQVERSGDGAACGLDLIFTMGGNSVSHYEEFIPEINNRKMYYINLSNYSGGLSKISVAPVFCNGDVGGVTGEIDMDDFSKADISELIDEGILSGGDFESLNGGTSSGVGPGNNVECSANSYLGCYDHDVYWYDSCNTVGLIKESCFAGCSSGACRAIPVCESLEDNGVYVDVDGLCGDCSDSFTKEQALDPKTPFCSIQVASDSGLLPGDTVYVREGLYHPFSIGVSGSEGNKISFIAYPGENVVIDMGLLEGPLPSRIGIFLRDSHYILIDGFEIIENDPSLDELRKLNVSDSDDLAVLKNYPGFDDSRCGFEIIDSYNVTVQNLEVHHIFGLGICGSGENYNFLDNHIYDLGFPRSGYGFYIWEGKNNYYHGNVVHDAVYGFHIYSEDSGNERELSGQIIDGNLVYNTGGVYYHLSSERVHTGGYGIIVSSVDHNLEVNNKDTGNVISNNILYDTNYGGIYMGASDSYIVNNLVYNNHRGRDIWVLSVSDNVMVRNNIIYKNLGYDYFDEGLNTLEGNNLFGVDPLFVDEENKDFRLKLGSSAINTGFDLSGIVDFDFDGATRPLDGGYDIGPYEYI